jgi:fumarate hydratase subunit beta
MSEIKKIKSPIDKEIIESLRAGDEVLISGTIYTARDIAHKRLCETISRGEPLPFDIKDAVIYFVGPSPAAPGRAIGSAGPTTSSRMDPFSPTLLKEGLSAMIGKGLRGKAVIEALKEHKGVHFSAIGGTGALLSKAIKASEIVAYDDLGTEAIRKLTVEDFPAVVAYDCRGNTVYNASL